MKENKAIKSDSIYGGVQFSLLTDGWAGSGFQSKYQEISGRFVSHPDRGHEAQIQFEITSNYEKRSQSVLGGIHLTPEQAIEFAKSIVPKHIADAIDLAVNVELAA